VTSPAAIGPGRLLVDPAHQQGAMQRLNNDDNVWRRRAQTAFAWIFGAVCVVFLGVLGLWLYVSATATPIHPDAQSVPSIADAASVPQWSGAVEQARQIVRANLVERNLPGLSVAVGSGGHIVWAEGFGWADLEKRVKVTPATRFRIGTASVALTSAAVGVLLERGQLALDDEIQTHVPAYPRKQWPVTLRQLMAHMAGVRNDSGDEGPLLSQHCEHPAEGVRAFADRPLLFEPGTRFRFSSYGWILVSAAVEAAAHDEPLLAFMRRKIFTPLGMNDTGPDSATQPGPDRATPYFPKFAAEPRYGPDVMREIDYSCYAGSSVFVSTPSDLVRFAMAIGSGTLLERATVQLLQTAQRLPSGEETGYGLGWDRETATIAGRQTPIVGHDGDALGGRVASFMTLPEYGLTVSVISNISYADTYDLGVKIAEVFATRH
jgi:CubicO group peptidase (beta-lactamase class C family)